MSAIASIATEVVRQCRVEGAPDEALMLMPKSRSQQLSEKAAEEQRRCRDWLLPFMEGNRPKFLTKAELRDAAMRELNVSKNSFDFCWIDAIEETGRQDWYEPLRKRLRTKS